ncbi:DUF6711 family protein [Campylobacter sp.]|uniref:DUF6711 family protein n=1 Tax=Campylobacter sp. TaxID=205 RepID=UPI00338F515F
MTYFKIDGIDFSHYVNELKVSTNTNYNAQTNAAGNTVVDKINIKRVVEVGIIPLDELEAQSLLSILDRFQVVISYRNPRNSNLVNLTVIIPDNDIEYYTIQENKQMLKAFKLQFTEL